MDCQQKRIVMASDVIRITDCPYSDSSDSHGI